MNERKTRYVILGLLSESGLTGYDIKKYIQIRFQYFWQESYGQIYPELKKLMNEGLIICKKTKQNNKRQKTIYDLTQTGRLELEKWLSIPPVKEMARYEILLKIYFGSLTDKNNILNYIHDFRDRYRQNLSVLNLFRNDLKAILDKDESHLYILMTILFGEKVYQAYLDWCDEAEKILNTKYK